MHLENPGLLYVAATLLPLASFLALLLAGGVRWCVRSNRDAGLSRAIYVALGGDRPQRAAAYVATAAMGLAFVLCLVGFIYFLHDHPLPTHAESPHGAGHHDEPANVEAGHETPENLENRWSGSVQWCQY